MQIFQDSYASLELIKKYAGRIEGTEDDMFLQALGLVASRAIDDYTNRYWGTSATVSGERVRKIIGPTFNVFYTRYAPIVSVASLADDVRSYTENADFRVFADEGRIELFGISNLLTTPGISVLSQFPSFSRTPGAVVITYSVGIGPTGSTEFLEQAAPPQVQLATAMIAGSAYRDQDREGILSKGSPEQNLAFSQVAIPPKAKMILDRLVRWIC